MLFRITTITFFIILFSCNIDTSESDNSDINKYGLTYGIKEGIVEYKMLMFGKQSEIKIYFKEFGNVERIVSKIKYRENNSESIIIEKDNNSYSLFPKKKIAFKRLLSNTKDKNNIFAQKIIFNDLTDEELSKLGFKLEGTDIVTSITTDIYSYKDSLIEAKYWIWKNLPLKWQVKKNNIEIVTEAVKVNINPVFPDSIFEIPKDYKIRDVVDKDAIMRKEYK